MPLNVKGSCAHGLAWSCVLGSNIWSLLIIAYIIGLQDPTLNIVVGKFKMTWEGLYCLPCRENCYCVREEHSNHNILLLIPEASIPRHLLARLVIHDAVQGSISASEEALLLCLI